MEDIEEIKKLICSINNKNPYEMFSIDEAAIAFNISKQRITKALNCEELPEYKFDGKQRMLKRRDIEKWIDSKLKMEVMLLRAKNIIASNYADARKKG